MNKDKDRSRGGFQERRRQADWVIKAASILSFISWLVAVAALFVFEIASPDRINVSGVMGGTTRIAWNTALFPVTFILLILSVLSCITAFIFNAMRMRRKTDKYRKSIIIIGALSLIGLVAFTLRFSTYLF